MQWGELGFLGQIIEPFCVLKGFVAAPAWKAMLEAADKPAQCLALTVSFATVLQARMSKLIFLFSFWLGYRALLAPTYHPMLVMSQWPQPSAPTAIQPCLLLGKPGFAPPPQRWAQGLINIDKAACSSQWCPACMQSVIYSWLPLSLMLRQWNPPALTNGPSNCVGYLSCFSFTDSVGPW